MNKSAYKRLAIRVAAVALVLTLAGLALASCGSDTEPTDDVQGIALTEADDGASFTVAVGDTVAITLAGNPTTGYAWESDMSEEDASLLNMVGDEPAYTPDDVDPEVVGSGGVYTFTYEAVAPGQVELKLKYWRSFEPETEPIQTFSADLTIE